MYKYVFLIIIVSYYWGLGIGDWGLPNPQSPIPNPQSFDNIYYKGLFNIVKYIIYV